MTSAPILDFETGDEVGTLHDDGALDTEDEYLRATYEGLIQPGGVVVLDPVDFSGKGFAYYDFLVTPDDVGFLLAVVERLPSPYTVPEDVLRDLPGYSPEAEGDDG